MSNVHKAIGSIPAQRIAAHHKAYAPDEQP